LQLPGPIFCNCFTRLSTVVGVAQIFYMMKKAAQRHRTVGRRIKQLQNRTPATYNVYYAAAHEWHWICELIILPSYQNF